MALNSGSAPSGNFDLSDWKLQLPVDAKGSFSGKAAEIKDLAGYAGKWFGTGPDGAMVLSAPVDGATTGGSIYARSELREMDGSKPAEWTLKEGGRLEATLEVDRAPRDADGTEGRIVIGQVHGGDSQLVRLYWNEGRIYYATDDAPGSVGKDLHVDLHDAKGNVPNVGLNERFSYSIDVQGHDLQVSVVADGRTYTSSQKIDPSWDDNSFYFKAGTYLGANGKDASGVGQTSFFSLSVEHDGHPSTGGPETPSRPNPGPDDPTTPKPPVENHPNQEWDAVRNVYGNSRANVLNGGKLDEAISGGGGNDVIHGNGGDDVLTGGSGSDRFVFDRNDFGGHDLLTDFTSRSDTLRFDDAVFSSPDPGRLDREHLAYGDRAVEFDDFFVYDRATGVLSYDADGSGRGHAVVVATLENTPPLLASDIFVF